MRAWSKPAPCNKTGRRRSNRHEYMHSSDVWDRFPRLKHKNPPTIDDRVALFRWGTAAENFGTARAWSNPPPCNKTGRCRSNRRQDMHTPGVGDRFPRLKQKNPRLQARFLSLIQIPTIANNFFFTDTDRKSLTNNRYLAHQYYFIRRNHYKEKLDLSRQGSFLNKSCPGRFFAGTNL